MKVWVTKYLFSEGIKEEEGDINKDYPDAFKRTGNSWQLYKPHWHTSKQRAIDYALFMCEKKIDSISKSKQKVEKLRKELIQQTKELSNEQVIVI